MRTRERLLSGLLIPLTLLGSAVTAGAESVQRATPTPTRSARAPNVWLYTTTLKIPTYPYQDALVTTSPDDPIYPYPRLDFGQVRSPVSAPYTALVLQNPYLSVTLLPSLGGRVYRIRDRVTGRNLLYNNPVVKPTPWGARGWWLAAGGIEWALPTEEHGLIEWRPWDYYTRQTATQSSVTVHTTEARTGLIVWIKISLDATHSYLTLEPGIHNSTAASQTFQFWLNAMLSVNNNRVSDNTRFVFPATTIRIHSTDDGSLPGPGSDIGWPNYSGRDLSRYGAWPGHLGFFAAPSNANFAGAYDLDVDQGVVRVFPRDTAPGVKLFGPHGMDPSQWTDDKSTYVELWGGVTPTFWEAATLAPDQTIAWTERWYPVSGLRGEFTAADATAAVRFVKSSNQIEVAVAPTQVLNGRVVVWANGARTAEWPASASPGRPFRKVWSSTEPAAGALGVQILDKQGRVLSQYGNVP